MPELDADGNPIVSDPVVDPVVADPLKVDDGTHPKDDTTNEFRTWLLTQPTELQNDALLQNFKTFEDLARGYSSTKRWADGRVKLPEENAPVEEVNAFYQRLGVPESPDKYEFSKVDTPEAVGFDPKLLDDFRPVFHGLKLTKAQADGVQKKYLEVITAQHETLVTQYNQEVTQKEQVLKDRWGDSFAHNKDLAIRTFMKNATPGLQVTVEKEGWGNNPDFIELFFNLGLATGEDSFKPGGPIEVKTLDGEIKSVESELYALKDGDPKRKALIQKRDMLYQKRYPQN